MDMKEGEHRKKERYLQLCARQNIADCTTPANLPLVEKANENEVS
jgi:hypothetical protein